MNKNKNFEIDMCNGPIFPKMLRFAIPLMCSSVLQLLFNATDIVVVGRFAGDNSLAAVGSTTSLINLLVNIFIGFSVGVNVLVARYYGAKQKQELKRTVHTAIGLSILSGIILTVTGIIFAKQLLYLMDTPKEVLELAAVYLKIYFCGMVANMIYNFGSAILRAVGDTKRPMYYLLFAGCVNVVFNLFFVIILKMDVAGVGLATVISQCISAFLILRCLIKENGDIHLSLKEVSLNRGIVIKILRIGLPAGFQGVVFSLSNVVIQASVNSFGSVVMAGNAAAANIEGFVYVSMNAYHQAALSFMGQNIGAGKYERMNKVLFCSLMCVTVVGIVLGNGAVIAGNELLSIYSSKSEVIAAGLMRLEVICRLYALCGIMDVFVGALRGMGYSVIPMIVSLAGACGIRLVWIATIFKVSQFHNMTVLYLSYPVSWVMTFVVLIICYIFVYKKVCKK